uniref:Uncharacterized protein n=1 Tax=Manihot esculenta TaxID=3983 RepID=A0A2C9VNH5_MANES
MTELAFLCTLLIPINTETKIQINGFTRKMTHGPNMGSQWQILKILVSADNAQNTHKYLYK